MYIRHAVVVAPISVVHRTATLPCFKFRAQPNTTYSSLLSPLQTARMQTKQPDFWAAALTTYTAALVAFVLRIVARKLKGLTLFFDDYLALAAFVR
jgi:hypothetical protein